MTYYLKWLDNVVSCYPNAFAEGRFLTIQQRAYLKAMFKNGSSVADARLQFIYRISELIKKL